MGQYKKINHLIFLDDSKLYGNSEIEAESRNAVRTFSKNLAMVFGITKCAHVTIKAGKLVSVNWMAFLSTEALP